MSYRPKDPRAKLGDALLRDLGERETPERRVGPRFLAPPLDVLINRKVYHTIDWGLGALVLGDYDVAIKEGDTLIVVVSRADDPEVAHKATVRVARVNKKRNHLTLQFVEIGKGLLGWLGDLQLTGDATRF
jgi:hypothetical protein